MRNHRQLDAACCLIRIRTSSPVPLDLVLVDHTTAKGSFNELRCLCDLFIVAGIDVCNVWQVYMAHEHHHAGNDIHCALEGVTFACIVCAWCSYLACNATVADCTCCRTSRKSQISFRTL